MIISALLGHVLLRTIIGGAVLVAVWYAWNGLYLFAGGFVGLLAAYAYLSWWGDAPIEKRFVEGPDRP